jgi:signal recognition particle subunit SRP54
MTPTERREVEVLDNSRRRRIARGSGTATNDVGQLVRGFHMVSDMGRQMADLSMLSRLRALSGMGSMDLSALGSRGGGIPQIKGGPAKSGFKDKYKQRKKRRR